jgi:hypothetical protein
MLLITQANQHARSVQASQSLAVLVDTQTHVVSPWHMKLPLGCYTQLLLVPCPEQTNNNHNCSLMRKHLLRGTEETFCKYKLQICHGKIPNTCKMHYPKRNLVQE